MRQCGSDTFVQLPFIIGVALNFVSDPDPLVLKAYTPGYVQSQIDLFEEAKEVHHQAGLRKT